MNTNQSVRPRFLRKIGFILVIAYTFVAIAQQPQTQLSPKALSVKNQVARLSPKAHISVIPLKTKEEFGTFVSSDSTTITFYDIDRKTNVTLAYEALNKVKKGYGGYNTISKTHVDREKNFFVAAAVLGALAVLIGAATASR